MNISLPEFRFGSSSNLHYARARELMGYLSTINSLPGKDTNAMGFDEGMVKEVFSYRMGKLEAIYQGEESYHGYTGIKPLERFHRASSSNNIFANSINTIRVDLVRKLYLDERTLSEVEALSTGEKPYLDALNSLKEIGLELKYPNLMPYSGRGDVAHLGIDNYELPHSPNELYSPSHNGHVALADLLLVTASDESSWLSVWVNARLAESYKEDTQDHYDLQSSLNLIFENALDLRNSVKKKN